MNAVDGFARKPPPILDAAAGAAELKAGSGDGLQTEAGGGGGFAEVLSDVSKRQGRTGEAEPRSTLPMPAAQTLIRQTFLFDAGSPSGALEAVPEIAPTDSIRSNPLQGDSEAGTKRATSPQISKPGQANLSDAMPDPLAAVAAKPRVGGQDLGAQILSAAAGPGRDGGAMSSGPNISSGEIQLASFAEAPEASSATKEIIKKDAYPGTDASPAGATDAVGSDETGPDLPHSDAGSFGLFGVEMLDAWGASVSADETSRDGAEKRASAPSASGATILASNDLVQSVLAQPTLYPSALASTLVLPVASGALRGTPTQSGREMNSSATSSSGRGGAIEASSSVAPSALASSAASWVAAGPRIDLGDRLGQARGDGAEQGGEMPPPRGSESPVASASGAGQSAIAYARQTSALTDAGSSLAALPPIKSAVLDQQTHLPPAPTISPSLQIANWIALATGQADIVSGEPAVIAQSPGILGESGVAGARGPASALKILNLQLQPDSLGVVTIRMRLTGTRIDVQLEAERPETIRLIRDDKHLLVEKLRACGYSMESLVVKAAEQSAASPQGGVGGAQGGNDPSATQASAQATSQAGLRDGEGNANDRSPAPRDREPSRPRAAEDVQDSLGGDLFI